MKNIESINKKNSDMEIVNPMLIMLVMGGISGLSLVIGMQLIIVLDMLFPFFTLLNEVVEFATFNKDITTITVNIYLVLVFSIFAPSFILFTLFMKFVKNIKKSNLFQNDYYRYLKICNVGFTIIIVFFGFLPLLFSVFLLGEEEISKLNYIFISIMIGSIFPYFYLLIDEAKLNSIQPITKEVNVAELNMNIPSKKKYDNIYFLLSILFLIFIFLLIFYLYQQKFEWNSNNISNIISVIGILATFTAASAAAWAATTAKNSLLEQSLANERAAKPYLILKNKNYEVDIPSTQHPFLFNWDNGLKIENNNKNENLSFFQIHNISTGIAKRIEVKTEVKEYNSLIDILNKLEKNKNNTISILKNNVKNSSSILKINSTVKTMNTVFNETNELELSEKIEKFTALGIKPDDNILVRIPKVFIVLNNLIMSGDFRFDNSYSLPYLEVNITCESIQEKQYNFKYIVYLNYTNTNKDMFTHDKNIQFNLKVFED